VGILAALLGVAAMSCSSCKKGRETSDASASASTITQASASSSAGEGAPRAGMAWIPKGTFSAGTPKSKTPRVPDEEMNGEPVEMGGYYIDLLPYPNEPGAIPTTNVTRDEAEALCASKGKRLCTELEWEHACKGQGSTAYEYGDAYKEAACGTGVSVEQSARRPSGERAQCKSSFGVQDMHGGVWEWTSSSWGRDSKEASQGVLRGGNSEAGELVGRCANAIGRPTSKKSPTMGLRCCAGAKNAAEVKVTLKATPGFSSVGDPASLHDTWSEALAGAKLPRAWIWQPVANDQLVVLLACGKPKTTTCSVIIGRVLEDRAAVISSEEVGLSSPLPDVARIGDPRHLRVKGTDAKGVFAREITYVYGRVEIADLRRN